jgi:hypothetical protein
MPMPALDPARHVFVKLSDPTHTLPIGPNRLFPAEGMTVDIRDPFWRLAIADRSLRRAKPDEAAAPAPAPPLPDVLDQIQLEEAALAERRARPFSREAGEGGMRSMPDEGQRDL